MSIARLELQIPAAEGGTFNAYVAVPEGVVAPAVIMIQEIFGVNEEMRRKCDAMAEAGYIAVSPDLFWRLEPGVQLTDKTEGEWAKAFDLFNRFDVDLGIADLRSTLHCFRGFANATGKVGCVGYCLGGKLAYLMATRTKIDCAVSYYGVGLDALAEEATAIKNPTLLHVAEEDKFVNKAAQEKMRTAFNGNTHITMHSYPGVDHAFARTGGQHYDEAAATLANTRTADFLRENLKG